MVGFLGKGLLVDPTPKKSDLLRLTNDFWYCYPDYPNECVSISCYSPKKVNKRSYTVFENSPKCLTTYVSWRKIEYL